MDNGEFYSKNALLEEIGRLRSMLHRSYRGIVMHEDADEPVQYVGVYVLHWDDVKKGYIRDPEMGFVAWDKEEINGEKT